MYDMYCMYIGLYVRFTIGEVNGRSVCRMCKIMAVDLHGRGYKLAETGEFCTVRLSLQCGGEIRKLMRVCQISNSRITADEFDFYWKSNGNTTHCCIHFCLVKFWCLENMRLVGQV